MGNKAEPDGVLSPQLHNEAAGLGGQLQRRGGFQPVVARSIDEGAAEKIHLLRKF